MPPRSRSKGTPKSSSSGTSITAEDFIKEGSASFSSLTTGDTVNESSASSMDFHEAPKELLESFGSLDLTSPYQAASKPAGFVSPNTPNSAVVSDFCGPGDTFQEKLQVAPPQQHSIRSRQHLPPIPSLSPASFTPITQTPSGQSPRKKKQRVRVSKQDLNRLGLLTSKGGINTPIAPILEGGGHAESPFSQAATSRDSQPRIPTRSYSCDDDTLTTIDRVTKTHVTDVEQLHELRKAGKIVLKKKTSSKSSSSSSDDGESSA